MAKKNAIEKNNRRRRMPKKYSGRARAEGDRGRQEAAARGALCGALKLAKLPRNSSATRIHNRCELSGRPRGFYRKLKLSRIALRDLGRRG